MKNWILVVVLVLVLALLILAGVAMNKATHSPAKLDEELDALALQFVEMLRNNENEKAYNMVSETTKQIFPQEVLDVIWDTMLHQYGSYVETIGTRHEKRRKENEEYHAVYVTTRFETAVIDFKVVFDDERTVVGFNLELADIPEELAEELKQAEKTAYPEPPIGTLNVHVDVMHMK